LPYRIENTLFKNPFCNFFGTVQASNFGSHGNWTIFASSVVSLHESCTKNEQNRICRCQVFLKLNSHHSSVRRVLMLTSPSEKEVQSFHEVQG
jgi:hypothetical protein